MMVAGMIHQVHLAHPLASVIRAFGEQLRLSTYVQQNFREILRVLSLFPMSRELWRVVLKIRRMLRELDEHMKWIVGKIQGLQSSTNERESARDNGL